MKQPKQLPRSRMSGGVKKYRWYCGIDVGTNTGICVWDSEEKRIVSLETLPLHRALETVAKCAHVSVSGILVRVEDARLRKWIPKQKNEKAERGRREGAGYVKAHSQIWEAFLKDLGCDYEMVAPKDNRTKWDESLFRKATGWAGNVTEHSMDAAGLIIGF